MLASGAGVVVTVKTTPFETEPPVGVTVTLFVPAGVVGTVQVIEVAVHTRIVAVMPLKRTTPAVEKLTPVMNTDAPTRPLVGATELMVAVSGSTASDANAPESNARGSNMTSAMAHQ